MSSERHVRWHVTILLLSPLSLSIAVLDSFNARFAFVLRDSARADYTSSIDGILDIPFEKLQTNIFNGSISTAIITAVGFIIGILLSVNPKWLQKGDGIVLLLYSMFQTILFILLAIIGGCLADSVRGYQARFTEFSKGANIPYYSIIYYGNMAKAAYGSFLLVVFAMVLLIKWVMSRGTTR